MRLGLSVALLLIFGIAGPSPAIAQIPPPMLDNAQGKAWASRRDAILKAEAARVGPGSAKPVEPGESADGSSRFVLLVEVAGPAAGGLANVDASAKARAPDPARREAAKALFDLATEAARAAEPSFAFADECLRLVLERQPDHPEARRLLGYIPHGGGWATPWASEELGRGKVSDPTYGWVPADWVPHLKRGELPAPGGGGNGNRWLPTAEADALRRDWARGWQITTEHFEIRTNVPLNEAISFGRKLESLHQLFFALMADVIGADQLPLALRFRSPGSKPTVSRKPRYKVDYFATKAEFAQHLAPVQGEGAKQSLGTYLPKKEFKTMGGISYFYKDDGGQIDVDSTLYHEASHQLLFESAGAYDYARNVGNYWVFEGLGTYFETLQFESDGSLRVGGMVGPRIAQARARLLRNREFVPIEVLVGFNQARFQGAQGNDIYLNYAESMALAVFLMQVDGGSRREPFLDYVRDAYKGRLRGGSGRSLEDRLGKPYKELNREFLDYLGRVGRPGGPG